LAVTTAIADKLQFTLRLRAPAGAVVSRATNLAKQRPGPPRRGSWENPMLRDNPRVQDLVLVVARWAVLGGLVFVNLETPEPLIPLPILVGLGMYALFITIAFIGAWAGSRLFAYVQSVGDLAVVAAALILASN